MYEKLFRTGYAYLASAAIIAVVLFITIAARSNLGLVGATILDLVAVVGIGARFGRGPAFLAGGLSIAALDYFLIPPVRQFEINEMRHLVMLGGISAVIIIVTNLTELLRRERERARARDEQARAAHLEAEIERERNAILSTVSHDLRTPLATISASSQMLARNHDSMSTSVRSELLAGIAEQADRLEELLRNVVAMTRAESRKLGLHIEIGSVSEVVGSALRRCRRFIGEREVTVRRAPNPPFAAFDASLLEQVFVNLLENAVRYSPRSSPIDVAVDTVGNEIVVKVEDRGDGLPDDELEKVFEKFYRGSNASKGDGGIGLGLSICRAVLAAHGGTIRMIKREGGGTTVRVVLAAAPLTVREAEAHLPSPT